MAAQSDEHGPPLGVFKPAHILLFFFGVGDLGVERTAKIIAALDVIDVALTFIETAVSNNKETQEFDDWLRKIFEGRRTIGVRCVPARVGISPHRVLP